MIQTHQNGAVAESMVQTELYQQGCAVSVPASEEPYDLIADVEGELFKVQVKSMFTRESNGKTRYRAELRPTSRDGKARYSNDNVDAFALYNASYNQVYWLWFDEAPATEACRKLESWQKHSIHRKI